jgi:hypothetical protein
MQQEFQAGLKRNKERKGGGEVVKEGRNMKGRIERDGGVFIP